MKSILSYKRRATLVVALSIFLPLFPASAANIGIQTTSSANASITVPPSAYIILFPIPKGGDTGITYLNENTPEMLPVGPKRLLVGPDGSFLIFDTAANRLLHYDGAGKFLNRISISSGIIADAVVYRGNLYVIGTDTQLSLYRLSLDGKLLEKLTVPMPKSTGMQVLNELKVNAIGDLVLEITDSALHSIVDIALPINQSRNGKTEPLASVQFRQNGARNSAVEFKGQIIDSIDFHTNLHSLNIFASQESGTFQLQTVEVTNNPTIFSDTIIRTYRSDGTLLGMARSPVAENYINVPEGVTAAADGDLYALITSKDGGKIVKLLIQKSMAPAFFEPEVTPQASGVLSLKSATPKRLAYAGSFEGLFSAPSSSRQILLAGACDGKWRTRSAMRDQAVAYMNNSKTLTVNNMNRSNNQCGSSRYVPRQFNNVTSSKNFPSVPYLWGGWDLPSKFNSDMDGGKYAGNWNTTYPSCVMSGVDCSGFISRAWNLTSKYSTSTLPSVSTQINTFNLSRGDILNYAGSHVRLVDSIDGNGAYVWESTAGVSAFGYGQFDGVSYRYYPWNTLFSYTPYKYQCVQ